MSAVDRIQKVTSKGQVTLPIAWRKKFNSNVVLVETHDNSITISPVEICDHDEYTVFDALRDNKGKGIKAKELLTMLKDIKE
jgi:bifunctional DNA-binding transcriptional regulator/antitoxin component of YhaV-PrlF toxin-antitoxin module